jgi:hypothetical protein
MMGVHDDFEDERVYERLLREITYGCHDKKVRHLLLAKQRAVRSALDASRVGACDFKEIDKYAEIDELFKDSHADATAGMPDALLLPWPLEQTPMLKVDVELLFQRFHAARKQQVPRPATQAGRSAQACSAQAGGQVGHAAAPAALAGAGSSAGDARGRTAAGRPRKLRGYEMCMGSGRLAMELGKTKGWSMSGVEREVDRTGWKSAQLRPFASFSHALFVCACAGESSRVRR